MYIIYVYNVVTSILLYTPPLLKHSLGFPAKDWPGSGPNHCEVILPVSPVSFVVWAKLRHSVIPCGQSGDFSLHQHQITPCQSPKNIFTTTMNHLEVEKISQPSLHLIEGTTWQNLDTIAIDEKFRKVDLGGIRHHKCTTIYI